MAAAVLPSPTANSTSQPDGKTPGGDQPNQGPAAPTLPAPDPNDPFAAMGGGVKLSNGGWVPKDHPLANSPLAPPPTNPDGTPAATPQTIQSAFQNQLQRLLSGPTAEEAGANAASSPEALAYQAAQQRNLETQQRQLAEDNAVGGNNANSAGGVMANRALRQQQGEAGQQFIAQLTTQKIQARRDELNNALSMAQTMGDNAAARDIQLQIANIDAAVRNRATDVQSDLGTKDLDLRKLLGLADDATRRYGIDKSYDASQYQTGLGYAGLETGANKDATPLPS